MLNIGTTKIMGNMTISIPKAVATALEVEIGNHIDWYTSNGEIVVKRKEEE